MPARIEDEDYTKDSLNDGDDDSTHRLVMLLLPATIRTYICKDWLMITSLTRVLSTSCLILKWIFFETMGKMALI